MRRAIARSFPPACRARPGLVLALAGCCSLLVAGCSPSAISTAASDPDFPKRFAQGGPDGAVSTNWLREFDDLQLSALVSEAVEKNYALEQERARLAQAEQTVIIARANRFPELDLTLAGSRRGFDDSNGRSPSILSLPSG